MKIQYLISTLLLLVIIPLKASAIEPPPAPADLSDKERSAMIAIYESLVENTDPLSVGDSEEALLNRLGPPDSTMELGSRKRYSYGTGSAVVNQGRIIQLNGISAEWLATPNREAFDDFQRASGNVFYMGRWMSIGESQEAYAKAVKAQELTEQRINLNTAKAANRQMNLQKSSSFLDIRQNGAQIDERHLISPGKITIVDFYADWCGPCKQIAPYLTNLSTDPDIAIRKVDIVNWGSPVAKQWKLRSIPNMRVYDRNGRQVGKATHDLREIYAYIKQAKQGY